MESCCFSVHIEGLAYQGNSWFLSTVHVTWQGKTDETYGFIGRDYFPIKRESETLLEFACTKEQTETLALRIKVYRPAVTGYLNVLYGRAYGRYLETKYISVHWKKGTTFGADQSYAICIQSTGKDFLARVVKGSVESLSV